MTWSPITTRTPPISSLSTLTCARTLRPVCFSSRAVRSASCAAVELECRLDIRLDRAFALVFQRFVLRADFAQQREPVVVRQHAHEVLALCA